MYAIRSYYAVYTNVAGISTPISKTITDVGGQVDFELSASAGVGSYIVATEPVYVYQLVSLGGTNQEMGSGILPPLDGCTGSNKVGFVRNLTGDFYVQLTARKKDISSFVVTVGGATDVITSYSIHYTKLYEYLNNKTHHLWDD